MSKSEGLEGWEDSEFPILCETCLGENPYVRMTREQYGKECKVCAKPFTVFRWLPGRGMRYKKTEICQSCAKYKNVCQTCILDLSHGLPVQVRDTMLGIEDQVPKDPVNRQVYTQQMANKLEKSDGSQLPDYTGKAEGLGKERLKRMARKDPYYKRNRPHICSFFVKGQCTRGNECPYRHEMPVSDPELAKQNIVDRYHGNNDPVAKRMLARASKKSNGIASPPDDKSITSLFVIGIDPSSTTQADLKSYFYPFGEIKSVVVVSKKNCAFVNYKTRASAEAAASDVAARGCTINGKSLHVTWGKAKPKGPQFEIQKKTADATQPSKHSIPLPPGAASAPQYPSQDPTAQGSSNA